MHHMAPMLMPVKNCQEIPTLERSKLAAVFTEADLKKMHEEFMKIILAKVDYYVDLPLAMCLRDPNNLWYAK
jgi:hypothetical protein